MTKEILAQLTDEQVMALPRATLEQYCRAVRINPKARKQDLQAALKKQARALRQHARRNQKTAKSQGRQRDQDGTAMLMFAGQEIPNTYPGARGSNLELDSTLAGEVRGAAMEGDVIRLQQLLGRLSPADRTKVANAGGEEEDSAGDHALHLACWKGHCAAAAWLLEHCLWADDRLATTPQRGVAAIPLGSPVRVAAPQFASTSTAQKPLPNIPGEKKQAQRETTARTLEDVVSPKHNAGQAPTSGEGSVIAGESSVNEKNQRTDDALVAAHAHPYHPAPRAAARSANSGVNAKGRGGLTPLHWAVKGTAEATVAWLLAQGADTDIRDDRGNTALDDCLVRLDQFEIQWRTATEVAELRGEDEFRPDADQQRLRAKLESIKQLLVAGSSVQQRSREHSSLLLNAGDEQPHILSSAQQLLLDTGRDSANGNNQSHSVPDELDRLQQVVDINLSPRSEVLRLAEAMTTGSTEEAEAKEEGPAEASVGPASHDGSSGAVDQAPSAAEMIVDSVDAS